MSAGILSRAMTAHAPASSAILACSGVVTSMMTPPFSIWASSLFNPYLLLSVIVAPPAPSPDGPRWLWLYYMGSQIQLKMYFNV